MKITKLFPLSFLLITLTSCSSTSFLPNDTLYFVGSNLYGFVDNFNPSKYQSCNAMKIPKFCTRIVFDAFRVDQGTQISTIPEYIDTLEFDKNCRCVLDGASEYSIFASCFASAPFKKIILADNLTLGYGAFAGNTNLSEIDWYLTDINNIKLSSYCFSGISESGVIKSLNKNIKSFDILKKLQETETISHGKFNNWKWA